MTFRLRCFHHRERFTLGRLPPNMELGTRMACQSALINDYGTLFSRRLREPQHQLWHMWLRPATWNLHEPLLSDATLTSGIDYHSESFPTGSNCLLGDHWWTRENMNLRSEKPTIRSYPITNTLVHNALIKTWTGRQAYLLNHSFRTW
jgi:hypothetical protein